MYDIDLTLVIYDSLINHSWPFNACLTTTYLVSIFSMYILDKQTCARNLSWISVNAVFTDYVSSLEWINTRLPKVLTVERDCLSSAKKMMIPILAYSWQCSSNL